MSGRSLGTVSVLVALFGDKFGSFRISDVGESLVTVSWWLALTKRVFPAQRHETLRDSERADKQIKNTISFAISTVYGWCGRAAVRAVSCCARLVLLPNKKLSSPHHSSGRKFLFRVFNLLSSLKNGDVLVAKENNIVSP